MNPADLLTRGLSYREFSRRVSFWKFGPDFLKESPLVWPNCSLNSDSSATCSILTNTIKLENNRENSHSLDMHRFSCIDKLYGVTAQLFKVASIARRSPLTRLECLSRARLYWLKSEQSVHFSDEIKFLQSSGTGVVPPLVRDLNLFLDDSGLVRCRGRLSKCNHISYDVAYPILISRNSYLAKLKILNCHLRCKHMGPTSTLNTLRNSGYWLPRPRPLIKSILKECILCKRFNSLSFRYPKPTDYLGSKVNFVKPFENVGVDFTGHFNVKLGTEYSKMYLVIFTCLSIRAVHLELVPNMSTASFLSAFLRFTSRFGLPKTLYSDNAPSFKQAAEILNDSSKDSPFVEFLNRNLIKHVRIPLYSAWFGSAWERLIKVVKSCLYKTIGRSKIEYFSFFTILADVQNAVNNRPLTYFDAADLSQPIITPNSFLMVGSSCDSVTFGASSSEFDRPSQSDLISTLQTREDVLDEFRDLWYQQYLLSLRETSKDVYQPIWEDKIKIGDIVLISSPIKPRPLWSLGRVTKLFTGADGKTRSVELVRSDRTNGNYAISLLYPLELSVDKISYVNNADIISPVSDPVKRPRRAAAEACLSKLRSMN